MSVIEQRMEPSAGVFSVTPLRGFSIAFAFITGLALFALLEPVRENPALFWSFVGAVAVLLAWSAVLFRSVLQQGRKLTLEFLPRPQHYLQACCHTAIFAYWGWYWRQVYDSYYLVIAQLVFAYAVDLLLSWSRRDSYTLGFGPFPIVFSTNLFLLFKPDWFYFQFMMVGLGFAAKELVRWNKEGRNTHLFNPSAFTLTVFSLGLILTGTTDITWGKEISISQAYPPHMYLFIFLIGLPVQYLFGVTTMTMSAVVTTYLVGLTYYGATGVYFFIEPFIPIAVFLGMHLLFTDPSTAPRTELGRVIFGSLYGLGNIILYAGLHRAGVPEFYDKLLPVPILNLMIQWIDWAAKSERLRWLDPSRIGRSLVGRRRHLAYMSLWILAFAIMRAVPGVGETRPDQFRLKVHREIKEVPVYELVIAKSGSKLKLSADQSPIAPPNGAPPSPTGQRGGPTPRGTIEMTGGSAEANGVSIAIFVQALSQQLDRPLIDKTGLQGLYDIKLQWTPESAKGPFPAAGSEPTPSTPDPSGPSIFTAIQEQLGLRLESAKGSVEVEVVDGVQKSSEN